MRFGVTGSLASVMLDSTFHAADTVNIRAKASELNISTTATIKNILSREGPRGFYRGFAATCYGAMVYGFCYFSAYKVIKSYLKEYFGGSVDLAVCYLLASFTTETLTLSVKYPFDLIKCRLQSANVLYNYQSVTQAFH